MSWHSRRAYILIVVLGLATLVASLGIAFIEANSTAMPAASNRKYGARARYLAESGIELGKHYLLYPPSTVVVNDYWRGGSNIAVDETSDFTSVLVTPHATLKQRFTIQARGVAKDPAGAVKGKKKVTAEVLVPKRGVWEFNEALLLKSALSTISARVQINGSVHSNGALTGSGACNGKVSACLTALWLGTGPPTSVVSLAPAMAMPAASGTPYSTYTLNGQTYTAYFLDRNDMGPAEAAAINAMNMTATNPGRLIRVKAGDFKMKTNVALNGSLIVGSGNLELEKGTSITAVSGFPAVVVSGDMKVKQDDSPITVNGSVICGGKIDDEDKRNINFVVNGTMIVRDSIAVSRSDSRFKFIFDLDRSWFYDFENVPTRQPVTVLSYMEE